SSDRVSVPGTSLANRARRPSPRATANTRAPLRMPASTICRPTPRLPPITTMVLPARESMLSSCCLGGPPAAAALISETGEGAGIHRWRRDLLNQNPDDLAMIVGLAQRSLLFGSPLPVVIKLFRLSLI